MSLLPSPLLSSRHLDKYHFYHHRGGYGVRLLDTGVLRTLLQLDEYKCLVSHRYLSLNVGFFFKTLMSFWHLYADIHKCATVMPGPTFQCLLLSGGMGGQPAYCVAGDRECRYNKYIIIWRAAHTSRRVPWAANTGCQYPGMPSCCHTRDVVYHTVPYLDLF
jgi:hypothetical protein